MPQAIQLAGLKLSEMLLSTVTITGADKSTDQQTLSSLSKKYPFVEWGILFSQNRYGTPRYPDNYWIKSVGELPLNLSAHFCGWFASQIIEKQNFKLISALPDSFRRVQLNYNFGKSTGPYFMLPVIDYAKQNPERAIILQLNKSNREYIEIFEYPKNIHFLYDSSGGRGTEINSIQSEFRKNFTGYAGGLGPNNIQEFIYKLSEQLPQGASTWIDMESKVRTTDNLSLDFTAIEFVLNTCWNAEVTASE